MSTELDIIVVSGLAEGFQTEFNESNAWWEIRISSSMLNHIRYIASFQVALISSIAHLAEVLRIDKYKEPISISVSSKSL